MANDVSSHEIAGTLTAKDWQERKIQLNADENAAHWDATFDDFLMKRLKYRYLNPIKLLQENSRYQGEGFTIVSIQCAIIEFLAALKEGKNYKYLKNGEKLGEHEYAISSKIFCDFLTHEDPFGECFPNNSDSQEFYRNVRCALLHEARTKNGWRILATSGIAVDVKKKIVRRDQLQDAITSYLKSYKELLIKEKSVQEAFIRKFDHLADICP